MSKFDGATWRKSTKSQQNGACVEVAEANGVVGIRDSKDQTGPVLVFELARFAAFLRSAAQGEF